MMKRIPSLSHEAKILRILSSVSLDSARNHTAFPSDILWNDRIILTPMYYDVRFMAISPNFVLMIGKQLTEVRA